MNIIYILSMRSYYIFLKDNFIHVFFGWLLTFFSSFGQTFFISLFVPGILEIFHLTKSAFGGYYAAATIIASFFLLQFGHLVDSDPIRPFTLKSTFLLVAACLLLAFAVHPVMIFIALIGLRLGGQGLMSHISLSVMSRHFSADRGKALGITAMGYPMGEMIFPILTGVLISFWNWRIALISAAVLLAILLFAFSRFDLNIYNHTMEKKGPKQPGKWTFIYQLIREKRFLMMIIPVFSYSFINTALFFYQYVMAKEKGWPMEWYSICFASYAVIRFLFLLYGGILTDRFSAKNLYPFYLLPSMLGLLALAFLSGKEAPLLYLTLTGISAGLSTVITESIIAELYGTERVGQVRSLFSVVMVLSTALAPVTFGLLLDHGATFSQFAFGCACLLAIVTLNNFKIKYIEHEKRKPINAQSTSQ